jgi:hypothetical protein
MFLGVIKMTNPLYVLHDGCYRDPLLPLLAIPAASIPLVNFSITTPLDAQRFLFWMFAYSWFHFSIDVVYCFGKVDDGFVQNIARLVARNRRIKIFYDKILDNSDKNIW